LQNIKQGKAGRDFVASVQLLGYHQIAPDPETLQAIKTVAAAEASWNQKAAARYLKEKAGSATPTTK
jgi:hypothetical protein